MPNFTAKVKTKKGVVSISISARNREEAHRHASSKGRIIAFNKVSSFTGFRRAMTPDERQTFFTRLSAMLSSRVGTSDALNLLRDTFTGKIQEVASRLLSQVETGDDLATAFEKVGEPDFPEATVALIKAGSRSGDTWRAIKDANEFEFQLANVKKGASKGLLGGVVGFLIAGVTTVASTVYVGPKIMESDMIKSASKSGEAVDISIITLAGNIMGYLMAVLLVIGVLGFILSAVGRKLVPVQADKLILKIPYYKDLVLARNNFIVLYGLGLLVRSGVRIEEALRLSAEGAPKGALRQDLVNATNAVKTGRPWPKVMETLHPTDKAALMSAQDRDQIASTLDTLAGQYRELYASRLGSFVPTLQLVSALFLALAGGILFGEAILPMLMAAQNMS